MVEELIPVAKLFSALLTPVIAILAAYIAYQQWQTNRRKLDWDRYERRLRVYEATKSFLAQIMREANLHFDDISKFISETAEADLLFGPEIPKYLRELRTHANELRIATDQYRDSTQIKPEGYEHSKTVETKHTELCWLAEQFDGKAKEKFAKYLKIGT